MRISKKNPFNLKSLYLFCFNSGINILVERISFEKNEYKTIASSLFSLRDSNGKGSDIHLCDLYGKEAFSRREFHNLVLNAIFSSYQGCNPEIINTNSDENGSQYVNIFSYLECTEEDFKDNGDDMLFRLSHCYKDEIKYSDDSDDKTLKYVNNNNCVWGISPYGNTCIAFCNDHTKHFYKQIKRDYLLSYVSLLHQKYVLYGFLDKIPGELTDSRRAKALRNDLYEFEMNYNLKVISELPQYQNVYRLTYQAFNIGSLMTDIREPLDAKEAIIREEEKKAEEERIQKDKEARIKAENEEKKRDQKINDALSVISLLTIISALLDLCSLVSEFFNISDKPIAETLVKIILCVILFAIWAILCIPILRDIFKEKHPGADKKPKKKDTETGDGKDI